MTLSQVKKRQSGFTIVELLIVIVIIGILAAITIVAYNGIQNKANDSAVQSDLDNIAKKIQLYYIDNGAYPKGPYGVTTDETQLKSLSLTLSLGAYITPTSSNNVVYCSEIDGSNARFSILAKSKSGNTYVIGNATPLSLYSSTITLTSIGTHCSALGYTTTAANFSASWGWENSSQKWRAWTGGNGS